MHFIYNFWLPFKLARSQKNNYKSGPEEFPNG